MNTLMPPVEVEGKSLYEFLVWASREMGLELRIDAGAEADARKGILRGTIDKEPAIAVPLRAATVGLDSHIEGGVIHIFENR